MFDKNFKIKVSGNWCEYQPNKHIDLSEIISFECWADQLGNPYRFHLKNGSYHYIERYEIGKQIEIVLKEQQAKVEELQQKLQMALDVIQCGKEVRAVVIQERDELQKRVDLLEKSQNSLEPKAEESECVSMCLDDRAVAKCDEDGIEYSLWGRVCQFKKSNNITEDDLERIYWEFDSERSKQGEERLRFKETLRGLLEQALKGKSND